MPGTITDDLKAVIASCGKSLNSIARSTGVPQPRLHSFVNGSQATLHLDHVQALCEFFGMRLTRPRKNVRKEQPEDHERPTSTGIATDHHSQEGPIAEANA